MSFVLRKNTGSQVCCVSTGLAMEELQRKVDKYESALKQLFPKLDEMKKERDDMTKERDDMTKERDESRAWAKACEEERDEFRAKAEEVFDLKARNKELQDKLDQETFSKIVLQNEVAPLQSQNESLKEDKLRLQEIEKDRDFWNM